MIASPKDLYYIAPPVQPGVCEPPNTRSSVG